MLQLADTDFKVTILNNVQALRGKYVYIERTCEIGMYVPMYISRVPNGNYRIQKLHI